MRFDFRPERLVPILALVALLPGGPARARDAEEARLLRHVETLAGTIGPRTPGTPQDRAAIDYIASEFARIGLQVERQEVESVPVSEDTDTVLSSQNVIGVLRGSPGRAILLGAHHDSRNATCPGAADDASGIAVLIEAARRLTSHPPPATVIFVSFAGEETFGLPGSREFLRRWKGPPLDLVVTMDFVSRGRIFVAPFPRPPELWASRLLARSTGGPFRHRFSFDPWLTIVPRIMAIPFAADHEPFLEAGMPALNLSCEFPAWLYHTPEDRPERLDPATLMAALNGLVGMVHQRVASPVQPEKSDVRYLPWGLGNHVVMLPSRAVIGLPALAVGAGLVLLFRRGRALLDPARGWRCLGWMIGSLPLTVLAISGGILAQWSLERVEGVVQPGYAHPGYHLGILAVAALGTGWAVRRWVGRFRAKVETGPILAAAALVQAVPGLAAVTLGTPDLAFPFLLGAGALLIAAGLRGTFPRMVAAGAGVLVLVPFLSPTSYRMFRELAGVPIPAGVLPAGLALLAWPWFLASLALFPPSAHRPRPPGARWRGPVLVGVVLLLGAGAAMLPAYDEDHRAVIEMTQTIDPERGEAEVGFRSVESLKGVILRGAGNEKLPDRMELNRRLPFAGASLVDIEYQVPDGEGLGSGILIAGRGGPPPRLVIVRVQSDAPFGVRRGGKWEQRKSYRQVRVPVGSGYSFEIPVRLENHQGARVEVAVVLDEDFLHLRPEAPFRVIRPVTRIRHTREISGTDSGPGRGSDIIHFGVPR